MSRSRFAVDEAALLKTYGISSLSPTKWENVDHELTGSVAGALTSTGKGGGIGGGPTAGEEDPLGLGRTIDTSGMDLEAKAAILINSKSFDPKAFLPAVHPNATYQDLLSGVNHLKSSLETRSGAIRILVEDNFDRFVAVKASTDALYAEMREGTLADDTDYATRPLRNKLKLSATKADQVFLPVLENANKAHKLRSTLGVFERSKFFFNLPSSLMESIEAGRYDATLRDYKKGKFLLDSRPGQLLPIPAGAKDKDAQILSNASSSSQVSAEAQQKRILDKVWNTVEKVMGEMKTILLEQLKEKGRSVEEVEKTIEILLELNTSEDPTWVYFDSQHQHIMDQLKKSFEASTARIEDVRKKADEADEDLENLLVSQLRAGIASLDTKQPESVISQASGHEVWQAILDMVKGLSEVLTTSLPNFWKIARMYIDGKFKKSSTGSTPRRSATQCRAMALDIIKRYISLLSEFFTLSDIAAVKVSSSASQDGQATINIPAFVPETSNALTTAHYLVKVLGEMQEGINETLPMEVSTDASSGLESLLESARWRFLDALTSIWLRDATMFFRLENWVANPADPFTTMYLEHIYTFQKHLTTTSFKLAGGVELGSSSIAKSTKQNRIAPEFIAKISKNFLDSLYAFLDGLVHLASDEFDVKDIGPIMTFGGKGVGMGVGQGNAGSVTNRLSLLDLTSSETRILVVLSNFNRLSVSMIPSMMSQLEGAFDTKVDTDRQTLMAVVLELDRTLFESYVKPKSAVVTDLMSSGVLDAAMDWYETPPPTEIRSYMYEALIYLVEVHAHVSNVAKPLLDRILNKLVENVADEALRSFRSVRKFGMGGMLRATLEIEFLHQTLSRFVTPPAARTLAEVYNKISQAYVRRPGDENLQAHLDAVKKILADTRRATGIEFLCFRATKERKEKDGVPAKTNGERAGSGRAPSAPLDLGSSSHREGRVR